jgi:hypothetical protein
MSLVLQWTVGYRGKAIAPCAPVKISDAATSRWRSPCDAEAFSAELVSVKPEAFLARWADTACSDTACSEVTEAKNAFPDK